MEILTIVTGSSQKTTIHNFYFAPNCFPKIEHAKKQFK